MKRFLAALPVLFAALSPAAAAAAAGPATPGAVPGGRSLAGVTCPRAGSCWAVGHQTAAGVIKTLIEHWNGTRWAIKASPNVAASSATFLTDVSCSARLNCWAVGGAAVGTTKQEPIAEHWNGRIWRLAVLPEPAGLPADGLSGVWCLSATNCWAVGLSARARFAASRPLAEHWNGRKWSIVRTVSPGSFTNLSAVTCRRAANCWAVGAGVNTGLAEHWNGRKWSAVATPRGGGGGLRGVSCPGTDCIAVGNSGFPSALAERWNGTKWSLTPVPPVPSGALSGLADVSCVTSADCLAVGQVNEVTLAERWQGSKWVRLKSPNPAGAGLATLSSVSCTSARGCWAVGLSERTPSTGADRTLAEHWNGRRWTIVRTP